MLQTQSLLVACLLLVFSAYISHADLTTAAIGANEYANKVALYTNKNFYLYWNADKAANVCIDSINYGFVTLIFIPS